MRDESLVDHSAVPEIFVDGFSDHVVGKNGMMSCSGYRIHEDLGQEIKVRVVRLIWPAIATDEAISDARQAQNPSTPVIPARRAGRH